MKFTQYRYDLPTRTLSFPKPNNIYRQTEITINRKRRQPTIIRPLISTTSQNIITLNPSLIGLAMLHFYFSRPNLRVWARGIICFQALYGILPLKPIMKVWLLVDFWKWIWQTMPNYLLYLVRAPKYPQLLQLQPHKCTNVSLYTNCFHTIFECF